MADDHEIVCELTPREQDDEAPIAWIVEVGAIVHAGDVIGSFATSLGVGIDVEVPCTGLVTHLSPVAIAGGTLARVAPLAPDDPRVVERARVREALGEVWSLATGIAERTGRRTRGVGRSSCALPLAPLVARCAGLPDPALEEARILVQATADAAARCGAPLAGTVLLCDLGEASTRWVRLRIDAGRARAEGVVAPPFARDAIDHVVVRARAPDQLRALTFVDRALPLVLGAPGTSTERLAPASSPYAAELPASLAALLGAR